MHFLMVTHASISVFINSLQLIN